VAALGLGTIHPLELFLSLAIMLLALGTFLLVVLFDFFREGVQFGLVTNWSFAL